MEGVKFSTLDLTLNKFDGYGISIFSIEIDFKKIITISKGGSLFHFSICKRYEDKQQDLRLNFGILFFINIHKTIKVLKPQMIKCDNCDEFTNIIYAENIQNVYCKDCEKWM